ncbi:MAG: TonB-dependent receptor plug domain-containing protein, partial [Pseudomonadales bacterium]|nr:TonB-dependent receptor plug domain-containing protein [Pseudomonadales bacterium]
MRRSGSGGRAWLLACTLSLGSMTALEGFGADFNQAREQVFDIDIPAQNAADALNSLALQTGAVMLFPYDLIRAKGTQAVRGRYSLEDALTKLLDGSGLAGSLTDKQVIRIALNQQNNDNEKGEDEMRTPENRSKRNLLAVAIASLFAGVTEISLAQEDGALGRNIEEISVTGSRIRNTSGFTTPVPVTSVTVDELSDFEPGNSMAEQLDALPQFFGNQSSQRGGLALHSTAGASGLNIRRLGVNRSLVLLDGQRVVPTDKRGTVNVDIFPTALLRSVDVVTGGASAAYGADAVGGTVNFILDRRFEGLNISAGTGMHETGEGVQWNLEMAGGTSIGERLHLIGGISAMHIDEVRPNWRNLENFKFIGHITNPAWSPGAPAGIPQRLTRPWVSSATSSPTGLIRNTRTVLDNYKFSNDGQNLVLFDRGEGFCQSGNGCLGSQAGGREGVVRSLAYDFFAGAKGAEVVNRSILTGLEFAVSDRLSTYAQVMVGRTESNGTLDESYEAEDNLGAT